DSGTPGVDVHNPLTNPAEGPPAGNPDGKSPIPSDAAPENTSSPTRVIGNGTKESCTSKAVVDAVAKGGIITFNCGPDDVVITMTETAKIVNNTGPEIVLDGGGKVTLSGGGTVRILYMNTCDKAQVWTTPKCDNQDLPHLTVQNLTFIDGWAPGEDLLSGGGAIYVQGGRFKVVNSRFFNNKCSPGGTDVGGGAIRAFLQYNTLPVYIVNSTFGGGETLGNSCANGGALSSIGVSYTVINSLFSYNTAVGKGANAPSNGELGGGNGGAIYNDGNTYTLTVLGSRFENNTANEGGGAIFYVSNDGSGHLVIRDSQLIHNPSLGFETNGYPGIFVKTNATPTIESSLLQK
ncbi:MAG: hypothetical protein KC609_08820, partial [Myxococcales bacterium]|nr:hypothetical protein [Myxococcales bacterium]